MLSFDLIEYYFLTEIWLWPVIAISSLGAFWIYHRRVVKAMNVRRCELVENENRLKKALVEAESANRAKGAFLSSVSHEIRTPLNAIIGFSAIMADQELTSEQYRSYGDLVNVAGKSLSSLVNDILDLSALETLNFTLVPVSLKITDLMKEIRSIFKLIVEDKELDFIIRQAENIPAVDIDGKRLRQILINIIGNAVKFTDTGKVEITVDVAAFAPGSNECNLIFKISDTGIGIRQKDQSRIFREFEQESGLIHRRFGGSGLGLSIVRQLLERMGGTVQLESEVGVGSTFTITFLKVPISRFEKQGAVSRSILPDADSDFETPLAVARLLSTRDIGINNSKNNSLRFSESSVALIRDAFGHRFTELARGLNVELINALEVDLRTWADELDNSELLKFSAIFSRAAAGMKVAELLEIANTFRAN